MTILTLVFSLLFLPFTDGFHIGSDGTIYMDTISHATYYSTGRGSGDHGRGSNHGGHGGSGVGATSSGEDLSPDIHPAYHLIEGEKAHPKWAFRHYADELEDHSRGPNRSMDPVREAWGEVFKEIETRQARLMTPNNNSNAPKIKPLLEKRALLLKDPLFQPYSGGWNLRGLGAVKLKKLRAVAASDTLTNYADLAYEHNDIEAYEAACEAAETILDLALSFTPGVSWARDLYEFVTQRNLVTDKSLSTVELSAAFVGIITAGYGSKIVKNIHIVQKFISPNKIDSILKTEKFMNSAKKTPPIKTPYETIAQELTADLLIARARVDSGAVLYRVGAFGKSHVDKPQFWSLENPLFTSDYFNKYGVPPANAKDVDFFQTAFLKKGVSFITRPAKGLGAHEGGGIEVVVNAGDAALGSVVYLEKKGVLK